MLVHYLVLASQMSETLVEIDTDRVRPGMFVQLDLSWMDHPFPWNRFKIRSDDEVRLLRGLGLKTVRYCLRRSETAPLAELAAAEPVAAESPALPGPEVAAAMEEKRRRRTAWSAGWRQGCRKRAIPSFTPSTTRPRAPRSTTTR